MVEPTLNPNAVRPNPVGLHLGQQRADLPDKKGALLRLGCWREIWDFIWDTQSLLGHRNRRKYLKSEEVRPTEHSQYQRIAGVLQAWPTVAFGSP